MVPFFAPPRLGAKRYRSGPQAADRGECACENESHLDAQIVGDASTLAARVSEGGTPARAVHWRVRASPWPNAVGSAADDKRRSSVPLAQFDTPSSQVINVGVFIRI